jgi:plastocyanin
MHNAKHGKASWVISMLLTAVAVLLVGVACGGSSTTAGGSSTASAGAGSSAAATAPNTIMIKDFMYSPAEITVAPGAKITVTNADKAAHTVTAGDKAFDTGNIAPGQTGQLTAPTKPGSYPYICTIHPYMTGMLIVK